MPAEGSRNGEESASGREAFWRFVPPIHLTINLRAAMVSHERGEMFPCFPNALLSLKARLNAFSTRSMGSELSLSGAAVKIDGGKASGEGTALGAVRAPEPSIYS